MRCEILWAGTPKTIYFCLRAVISASCSLCVQARRTGYSSRLLYLSPFSTPPLPILLKNSRHTDRDESAIFSQLQKYNRTGVKPYGLVIKYTLKTTVHEQKLNTVDNEAPTALKMLLQKNKTVVQLAPTLLYRRNASERYICNFKNVILNP